MIIDTSAMVATQYGEPEAVAFTPLIHGSATSRISLANYLELSLVIERQLGPEGVRQADAFVRRAAVDIGPVRIEQGHWARQAFLDFGKGRHKAGLNFGDCFAHALAKDFGEPLLFKGSNFSETDIHSAA